MQVFAEINLYNELHFVTYIYSIILCFNIPICRLKFYQDYVKATLGKQFLLSLNILHLNKYGAIILSYVNEDTFIFPKQTYTNVYVSLYYVNINLL